MKTHVVKILHTHFITHDVKRFVVEKPTGYDFLPGQATDVSLNIPGWETNLHPFTFTCLRDEDYLEFIIKIYNNPEGVTYQLGKMNAGAELILHDVFGVIKYKGPGVFIAGGAGITPFISIFRTLYTAKQLKDCKLIYSNKTSSDVILQNELEKMLAQNFIKVFTREHVIGFLDRRIDKEFLIQTIHDFSQHFYICGPDEFVAQIKKHLSSLGAKPDVLVFEQ